MTNQKLPYQEMEINTAEIIVPQYSYQRKLEPWRAKLIAANFDERIANRPKVSFRDGNYYAFDGQHTLEARKILNGGKDLMVTCRVYYGLTEEEEAMLFAKQFGVSRALSAGDEIRARVCGKDSEAVNFLRATESLGINLDYTQNLGENRIGCIRTAFNAYQRVGEENYVEALRIIQEAWEGVPHSLRREIVRAMAEFVNLYQREYDRDRLLENLKKNDPLTIYRKGMEMGIRMAGYKKYLYQILLIYNESDEQSALPLKF
ncbi:MAG: type II toxin-antitoxin system PemK/MazF family toxin [Lachnospiraceae bacterium]|nr:type II toxin-antitoxin system PemK/MazF family toxin [Lachnospiraceae bacterium]